MSTARNNGLRHAQGEYVWFIDSDDCISINSLNSIFLILDKSNFDIVRIEKVNVPEEYSPEFELAPNLIQTNSWLGPATAFNFIVRREYLLEHDIYFDKEISYGEDTMWVFWIGYYPNKHIYFESKLYNGSVKNAEVIEN